MAYYVDVPFEKLVENAPCNIEGMNPIWMVYADPPKDRKIVSGVIVKYEARQTIAWPIKEGRAYRITANRVSSMPYIENDQNAVRRFCRLNHITLRHIIKVTRGEGVCWVSSVRHQGDSGERCIKEGEPPVCYKTVETCGNPSHETRILVVKGEGDKLSWKEFCKIAQNWYAIKDGSWKLS